MRRRAAAVLLAALLAPGAARSETAGLTRVDGLLARAEDRVTGLEAAARGRAAGDPCPPGVSVARLAADLRGRRLKTVLGGDLPEEGGAKRDWQVYHICRALAESDPAICAQADAIPATGGGSAGTRPGPSTYRANCEVAYEQSRAAAARLRGDPRFPAICRDALPRLAAFKDAAAVDAVCRAWGAVRGADRGALVAAMAAGLKAAPGRGDLLDAAAELEADPARCARLGDDYLGAACLELDDFRRASAAAEPRRCRGGICRALMGGGPAACDEYSRSFLRAACEKSYAAAFAESSRAEFARLSEEAEKELSALDSGAASAGELAGTGTRLDRLYALRDRMDRAAAAYAVSASSAAPAGAGPAARKRSP